MQYGDSMQEHLKNMSPMIWELKPIANNFIGF